jgi:hypothetical protein
MYTVAWSRPRNCRSLQFSRRKRAGLVDVEAIERLTYELHELVF